MAARFVGRPVRSRLLSAAVVLGLAVLFAAPGAAIAQPLRTVAIAPAPAPVVRHVAPAAAASAVPYAGGSSPTGPSSTSTGGLLGFNSTFRLLSTQPAIELASSFWGADVRVFSPANASLAAAYNASGLSFVRWPGGAVADSYNITSNRIYSLLGAYTNPPTSISQFAGWCVTVHCRAIVQLPGEIDSPATAAYEVNYIENVVGFHPAYYEIGNEPALWRHFGVPWANWTAHQKSRVTPMGYAHLVHSYIAAIRAVDPSAQIVGLPGFGEGGYHESTWIRDSVAVNGPNLSAVAIHVYPSGRGPAGTPSLAQFFGTLNGHGTLAYRVPIDRAAIAAGCPNCTGIALLVTELGAGSAGGSYTRFMRSYDDVPYIGSEILQGIALNLTNIDLFALMSRYPGSIDDMRSQATPVGELYESIFAQLGRNVYPILTGNLTGGVHLAVLSGATPGTYDLLVVSTNTTTPQPVTLAGSGFPTGPGSVRNWNGSSPAPVVTSYPTGVPAQYVVPPLGVLLVEVQPPRIQLAHIAPGTLAPSTLAPRPVPPPATATPARGAPPTPPSPPVRPVARPRSES